MHLCSVPKGRGVARTQGIHRLSLGDTLVDISRLPGNSLTPFSLPPLTQGALDGSASLPIFSVPHLFCFYLYLIWAILLQ